ncbi:hypothetical protein B0A54_13322 [Friedmanniomyces endolithicus]|uniref:Endoglucanase n=1 Tax=Friedmanniomyces endolithicus TaxID=329885 RepID=A0A4U0UI62_9PEZI|nr:hypothetical protein B0A54_13322 [Friedmanniomyces endolithicus]
MKAILAAVTALVATAMAQVSPAPIPGSPQIVQNGDFSNGTLGWQSSPSGSMRNGMYCIDVPASPPGNSSYLRTSYKFLETKNDVYTLNFTASSSVGFDILVQTPDPPLDPNLNMTAALTTSPYPFSMTFSPANQAPNASLEFDLGGNPADATVCIGSVSMRRIDRSAWRQTYGPAIKINQLGYLPNGPKMATLVTNSTSATAWTLNNAAGDACFNGQTTYQGLDVASNQTVSIIDFSGFATTGDGYTLTAGGSTSYPFSISSTLYDDLRQDSLRFFYQQRSGIAIDGNLVGLQYARAAGHIQIPPNQGDKVVPCQAVHDSLIAYLEPWTCNYTLDVTQGWYDAGDQGKYVVNGGIAAAQLLMEYERTMYTKNGTSQLGDGSLRIPERNNGIPDVLDEARWELDFMMKMQVPANAAPQLVNGTYLDLSSFAHLKVHDNQWTPLPTDPSQDPKRPELYLTTGAQQYLTDLKANRYHTANISTLFSLPGGFSWASVAALGQLDLATVPSNISNHSAIVQSVVDAADMLMAVQQNSSNGYGVFLTEYPWGSNSNNLNNIQIVATAADLTGNTSYRSAALQGIDYVLGRNAISQSYVRGYGTKQTQNVHSRLYAHELDDRVPQAPPGAMAGGANQAASDPPADDVLPGCAPQTCYVDDVNSYSTNEVAINWNSALAWVVGWAGSQ